MHEKLMVKVGDFVSYQAVFKRYELKYLVNQEQKAAVLEAMKPYMSLDKYGRTTIRNIYFDTDSYLLIRRSNEKPVFKEKLRIRSYKKVSAVDPVFVELKKKYQGIVYKRRLSLSEKDAMDWIVGGLPIKNSSQISNEIDYFLKLYGSLSPKLFLSYEREAFFENSGGAFRVTFDENILGRDEDISLQSDPGGVALLKDGLSMMELKTAGAIPIWLSDVLTKHRICKASFSKYGTFYDRIIFPKCKGGFLYV